MAWVASIGLLYFSWWSYSIFRALRRIGDELYLIRKGEKEPEDDGSD